MSSTNANENTPIQTNEQQEILFIKEQINLIWQEIYSIYTQLGKKYVAYVAENGIIPEMDSHQLLTLINEKNLQKEELENKIEELLLG